MPEQENEKTRQEADKRPGPLDGLLVADFSRVLAGPYCTILLGDLGTRVIKVESPARDDTRSGCVARNLMKGIVCEAVPILLSLGCHSK
jgi:crotonobetainyl-CoA:carnitine CoA-transferase CaiB-like acyl-CoA transferase